MKGRAAILFATCSVLFSCSFIDFLYNLRYCRKNLLIAHDFLDRISQQYVHAVSGRHIVLLPAPALPYPPFQQIALYCALEQFLRNGNEYSAALLACIPAEGEFQARHLAVPASGKKQRYSGFPAESFFFWKSIPMNLHGVSPY